MTASLNTFRTPDPCGYSVMINAPKWLTDQVKNIQYELADRNERAKKKPVTIQISLVNLLSTESHNSEKNILQSVEKIASMIHCIQVTYTGFSFFNAEEAFRINIKDQDPLVSLRDLLQGELQPYQLLANPQKPAATTSFLAGEVNGVDEVHYEFINDTSTNDFRVSSLSILKKVVDGNAWELLKEVPFGRV